MKKILLFLLISSVSTVLRLHKKIKNVKFEVYSQLEIIDQYAFYRSKIDEIVIPKSTKIIGKCSFSECSQLKKVEFKQNSKLFLESYLHRFGVCISFLFTLTM